MITLMMFGLNSCLSTSIDKPKVEDIPQSAPIVKVKPNNWVFIDSPEPDNQYAIDTTTAERTIGDANYWIAKLFSKPKEDGLIVTITQISASCYFNKRAMLRHLTFNVSGDKTSDFKGASDFFVSSPPDHVEAKIIQVICGTEPYTNPTEKIKTLSVPLRNNPLIKQSSENILFNNKHLDN
jgi:hypothetical protein